VKIPVLALAGERGGPMLSAREVSGSMSKNVILPARRHRRNVVAHLKVCTRPSVRLVVIMTQHQGHRGRNVSGTAVVLEIARVCLARRLPARLGS